MPPHVPFLAQTLAIAERLVLSHATATLTAPLSLEGRGIPLAPGEGTPRVAPPAVPKDVPPGDSWDEPVEPSEAPTAQVLVPGADLLTGGMPWGLSALERALRALTEPETYQARPRGWLWKGVGAVCWVAAAAMAYMVMRQPSRSGNPLFRLGTLRTPPEDLA